MGSDCVTKSNGRAMTQNGYTETDRCICRNHWGFVEKKADVDGCYSSLSCCDCSLSASNFKNGAGILEGRDSLDHIRESFGVLFFLISAKNDGETQEFEQCAGGIKRPV